MKNEEHPFPHFNDGGKGHILALVPVHHLFGEGWFYFLFYSDQDCGLHAVTLSWSKFGIWRCLFCGWRKTGEL